MSVPGNYSFISYLLAKQSVDDRSLNRHVWDSLSQALRTGRPATPVRVLEIGAGIGLMFERLLDWGLLKHADYTALDLHEENIVFARQELPEWASRRGYFCQANPDGSLVFSGDGLRVWLHLEAIDVHEFIARRQAGVGWELLVAHALLDLLDIPAILPGLLSLCRPGGLFYFTINFDGLTMFEPAIDPAFDALIQDLYHRTMDERVVDGVSSGDSHLGRHLFGYLNAAGAHIIDAGASDWVVLPVSGGYPQDEAYFLHFIVHTIHQALAGRPELDALRFERWILERHAQIERHELVFIAHQLDFVGRASGAALATSPSLA